MFKTKSRAEYLVQDHGRGTDICFAPIQTMEEAPKHPHMAARQVFVEPPRRHPARPCAPRFSRTPSAIREPELAEHRRCNERVEGAAR